MTPLHFPPAAVPQLNLKLSLKIAEAAQEKADELGIALTICVVESAGREILTMRGDGNGFLSTEVARGKATAAAAFRISGREMMERQKSNIFWTALPSFVDGVLPIQGGVPIVVNGETIGAVGCAGGSGEQDHELAVAGAQGVTAADVC